jgi:hypothetical protein
VAIFGSLALAALLPYFSRLIAADAVTFLELSLSLRLQVTCPARLFLPLLQLKGDVNQRLTGHQ